MRYKRTYPAQDYYDTCDAAVRARFMALTRILSDTGRLPDVTHGHFLKHPFEKILELKPRSGRFFGFYHGEKTFYVTNGADKRKQKEQRADYQRALDMMRDFYERLKNN